MQIRTILGILFVVLILQAVFSLFQIRQIYQTMEQQKQLYRGKDYTLAILQHLPLLCRPAPGGYLHSPHPYAPGDRGSAGGRGTEESGHPGHRRHHPYQRVPEGVRRPGH